MYKVLLLPVIFQMLFVSLGAVASEGESKTLHLSFGVYQSDKATVMYRKFLPVIEKLQESMEIDLATAVDIELVIFKGYSEANNSLIEGNVDFVRFGPASYAIAKEKNEHIQLIAMEHKKGEKRFKGLVVVPTDSPIKKLSDLKGHTFAFGNKNSTIGRYLVQAEMIKSGIYENDLSQSAFLQRHDRVFKAVVLGDYDAGAIKESTYIRYNKDNILRVIHSFENVTKPWVARADLNPEVVNAIRHSLLSLDDKAALKALKVSGFLPTDDDEYKFVRNEMKIAREFSTDE